MEEHQFGGAWTEEKLRRLDKYLRAYSTILSKFPFRYAYIDAFAGSGYRTRSPNDDLPLLEDLADQETSRFLDGSARKALRVEPPFHRYVFIEQDDSRVAELEALKIQFPDRKVRIDIRHTDANSEILRMCNLSWEKQRAVMFLDPYGMGVSWSTIEAIAATRAIDLWYLFPLGVAVNRMLPKDGHIPEAWRKKLDNILGGPDWFEAFYEPDPNLSLGFMDSEPAMVRSATIDKIGDFFVNKLKSVFAGVARNPLPLYNSKGSPLYLFCFAAANPKGAPTAIKIAQDILRRK